MSLEEELKASCKYAELSPELCVVKHGNGVIEFRELLDDDHSYVILRLSGYESEELIKFIKEQCNS